jgi:alkanesulfonate monooxygenase SsuD/methylene tetrahydromethanopterin reductase-like flavin-dependent oxidoreductase (luciferase family)
LLASSVERAVVNLRTGNPGPLQSPKAGYRETLPPQAQAMLALFLSCSAIGSPATVKDAVEDFVARTSADELMITSQIYDHQSRLKSYEILASVARD